MNGYKELFKSIRFFQTDKIRVFFSEIKIHKLCLMIYRCYTQKIMYPK